MAPSPTTFAVPDIAAYVSNPDCGYVLTQAWTQSGAGVALATVPFLTPDGPETTIEVISTETDTVHVGLHPFVSEVSLTTATGAVITNSAFTVNVDIQAPPQCSTAVLTCPVITLDYEIFEPALTHTFSEIVDDITVFVGAKSPNYCSPKSYVLQAGPEAYLNLDLPNMTVWVYSVDNTLSGTVVTAQIDVTLNVGEATEVTLAQTCPIDVTLVCMVATLSYTPVAAIALSYEIGFTTPNPTLTWPLKTDFTLAWPCDFVVQFEWIWTDNNSVVTT